MHNSIIIEASVLAVDKKIRIQLKLFNVFPEEQLLWSQTFDVDMSNLLKLYSQVIRKIASEIQFTLSPEQRSQLDESREVHPDSYKAYLRGKCNLYQQIPDGVKKGLEYLYEAENHFKRALALNPNLSLIHYHYAWALFLFGRHEDANRLAHKSFDILKDCPPGYFVLGETYLAMGREDLAIESHQKLAALAPP